MTHPDEREPCARARARIPALAAGPADASCEPALRSHLAQCAACGESYRAALELLAHLGRNGRRERLERERRERRLRQRKLAHAGAQVRGSGQRSARLRILIVPAFFVFLMAQLPSLPQGPAAARLVVLAGGVHAAGRELVPRAEPARLAPGETCALGPGARARLELDSASCELAGEARLWIEALAGARLRLCSGEIALEGRGMVVTDAGLAELESGRARLRITPEGLEAECLAGELWLVSSRGRRELAPGQSASLALAAP